MPAPGDQHQQPGEASSNPFEEIKPRLSEYTAQDIATLQSRLEKQLGPEYISSRSGPSGQKVHYVAAEKCIQLANEIFGFNGWSSQIMDIQVDFVDENASMAKISLGLSVIIRVTLRDGTFHEDIGYGHIENCKSKAQAFEKAKKEGTTDGLKRALRNFGNVLGNCIYDKEYLGKVTKIKPQPRRWDESNLHRHSTHAPVVKKELDVARLEDKSQSRELSNATDEVAEDEFGDFDEADFSVDDAETHPDEVVLPSRANSSHYLQDDRNASGASRNLANVAAGKSIPNGHGQSMGAPPRPITGCQDSSSNRSRVPPVSRTPSDGFPRSPSGAATNVRPQAEQGPSSKPVNFVHTVPGRILNQPARAGKLAPLSPAPSRRSPDDTDITAAGLPPQGAGFFSARAAAAVLQDVHTPIDGPPPPLPTDLPSFDPHTETPSLKRTAGVDQGRSGPVKREHQHPGASQAPGPNAVAKPNPVNAQLDATRRIGAPGSPSPMANRSQYKPLSMKRPVDHGHGNDNGLRTPLVDLPANGSIGVNDGGGGDVKRQRVNG